MKARQANAVKKQLEKLGVQVLAPTTNDKGDVYGFFASVPLAVLRTADYQRIESKGQVNKLVSIWDDASAEALSVSFRDNKLFIFNGNHRRLAAEKMGRTHLYAHVLIGLTYQQEAQQFFNLNNVPRGMAGWVSFMASYNAGNGDYKKLLELVEKHRLTTPFSEGIERNKDADIKSPTQLLAPFNLGGFQLVEAVLKVYDQAWRDGNGTRRNGLIQLGKDTALARGLSRFLWHHHINGDLKWKTIKQQLKVWKPAELQNVAKDIKVVRVDQHQFRSALEEIFQVGPAILKFAA